MREQQRIDHARQLNSRAFHDLALGERFKVQSRALLDPDDDRQYDRRRGSGKKRHDHRFQPSEVPNLTTRDSDDGHHTNLTYPFLPEHDDRGEDGHEDRDADDEEKEADHAIVEVEHHRHLGVEIFPGNQFKSRTPGHIGGSDFAI